MTLISRRFRVAGAIAASVSIACATLAAQTRKVAPAGPVKAIQPKILLPDLKINLTAADGYCGPDGRPFISLIVKVVNIGQGVADFTKVPFQTVVSLHSWGTSDPDDKAKAANGDVVLPQVGHALVLLPGQEWTTTLSVKGLPKLTGPKQNKYGFLLLADPAKGVAESNENNNTGPVSEPDPCFKK